MKAPGQPSPLGKARVQLGRMRSLVAEAHHVFIAGVRLGTGVAAVVRISIAIFHCGIHTGFLVATITRRTRPVHHTLACAGAPHSRR